MRFPNSGSTQRKPPLTDKLKKNIKKSKKRRKKPIEIEI